MSDRREAWLSMALRTVDDADAARKDCPPADEVWAAAIEEIPDIESRVIEHMVHCSVCRETWRLARTVDAPVVTHFRSKVRRWSPLLGLAAGLLLVIGLWPDADAPLRGTATPCGGLAIGLEYEPGTDTPSAVAWKAQVGASTYDVTIVASLREGPVHLRGLEMPSFPLSPAFVDRLVSGESLQVNVRADGADPPLGGQGCTKDIKLR